MSYGLIDHDTLKDIADSIRVKTGSDKQYYPQDMPLAILQIVTGGEGFDEPTGLSLDKYKTTGSFPALNTTGVLGLDVIYDSDAEELGPSCALVESNIEWASMSPGKMDLRFKSLGNNQFKFYLVISDGWPKKEASIIDISECFRNCSTIAEAYCGDYTAKMYKTYYSCTALTAAKCGPNVIDMEQAYGYCTSLITAKCGDGVKNMKEAYIGCNVLTHAEVGPNVENLEGAYEYCYLVNNDITIEKATKLKNAFNGCDVLPNIALLTEEITDSSANVENAFVRSTTSTTRKIVITHRQVYNVIVKHANSAIGNFELTEETYDEPVTVTVNEVDYAAVCCSYNTANNTYIYCTEQEVTNSSDEN